METVIHVLGWAGQGCFFFRFLVQWWSSERQGRIVVPHVFWVLSLVGAVFAGIYAWYEQDLIFLASPVINFFIYGRNLMIERTGRVLSQNTMVAAGLGILTFGVIALSAKIDMDAPLAWLVVGAAGQACWVSRFPIQWWVSERLGRAALPPAFFWISFVGSLLLLAYAIHTGVPIFIVGMCLSPLLYGRSLVLVHRKSGVQVA